MQVKKKSEKENKKLCFKILWTLTLKKSKKKNTFKNLKIEKEICFSFAFFLFSVSFHILPLFFLRNLLIILFLFFFFSFFFIPFFAFCYFGALFFFFRFGLVALRYRFTCKIQIQRKKPKIILLNFKKKNFFLVAIFLFSNHYLFFGVLIVAGV